MKVRAFSLAACFALALPGTALAVDPSEQLSDPALEARARAISAELRCLVCQNESIEESHALIARDLRHLVRERLLAGDSDEAVTAYVVDRYGEFVLLRPPFARNLGLWLGGPALLLCGLGIIALTFRARRKAAPESPLSPEEEAALKQLLAPGPKAED